MNLVTCKLCGRLFSANRGKICVTCLDEVDALYPRVREYLRDHSKEAFNVEQIADELDVDIRYVQALVELGYLDRDVTADPEAEEEKKRKEALARQLQASLENAAASRAADSAGKMYGQQRYGTVKKK